MSSNPDPMDENITGLEPGGGVPPGETPPAEGSISSDQGHSEGAKAGKAVSRLWLVAISIVVVLIALFFVGYITGLFDLLS